MHHFEFHHPASLQEAVSFLKSNPEAKVMAGGQSLIPLMKLGLAQPAAVLSLGGVKELSGVRRDGNELLVGALTTHAEVASSNEVRSALPALATLAAHIGDPQVRNRGTLGGSIAHADPAADYPAALLALGATIKTDRRNIAADDFFTGMFTTALEADELVASVRFPIPSKAAYAKFAHPASKFAIVGVFVAAFADGVRVAVTGATGTPHRAPHIEAALAQRLDPGLVPETRAAGHDFLSDTHASADYRAHLVGVMTRRAVAALA